MPGPGLDVVGAFVGQEGTAHGDVADSANQDALCTTLEGRDLKSQGASYPSAALVMITAGWEGLGVFSEEAGWGKALKNG